MMKMKPIKRFCLPGNITYYGTDIEVLIPEEYVEKDIANQPLDELLKDLKEIVVQNDIFDFFKQAGQLIG